MPEFPSFTKQALSGQLWRMVESQEDAATMQLVSDLDKQALLEQLLEQSKPENHFPELHYLLSTPFRYPPLKYGSRFGRRHEPSLFYGSLQTSTVMAECAYYRLVFWHDMAEPPPQPIKVKHSLFRVGFATESGVDLAKPPFDAQRTELVHFSDYRYPQALGAHLREQGVDCLLAPSARDPEGGLNVALFSPQALSEKQPNLLEGWLSQVDGERVSFRQSRGAEGYSFSFEQFVGDDGSLPKLA